MYCTPSAIPNCRPSTVYSKYLNNGEEPHPNRQLPPLSPTQHPMMSQLQGCRGPRKSLKECLSLAPNPPHKAPQHPWFLLPLDMQTKRVRVPTSKGAQLQPIAFCTQACTTTPATNVTPTASHNPIHDAPVAHQTCSHTQAANIVSPHKCASRIYSQALLDLWYLTILDETTGHFFGTG